MIVYKLQDLRYGVKCDYFSYVNGKASCQINTVEVMGKGHSGLSAQRHPFSSWEEKPLLGGRALFGFLGTSPSCPLLGQPRTREEPTRTPAQDVMNCV